MEEFLTVGGYDTGVRERSMQRYRTSWRGVREFMPAEAKLGDLTSRFVSEFKLRRLHADDLGKSRSPATINRDLAAIGALLSWCSGKRV